MNYGELPTTGLYIVLSIVVVWSAILTAQIAEVRARARPIKPKGGKRKGGERGHDDWKKDAIRLKKYATWLLRITKFAACQAAIVLLCAGWKAYRTRPESEGFVETWWSTVHILGHSAIVIALLVFLVKWFRSMERHPESPY